MKVLVCRLIDFGSVRRIRRWSAGLGLTLATCSIALAGAESPVAPIPFDQDPQVRQFVDEMVTGHDFSRDALNQLFRDAKYKASIIRALTRPAESKPWMDYRALFVTDARTAGGVRFWEENREALRLAHASYGVPPAIITAIIGVETHYGKNTGSFRVLDALSTLAFDYPPRAAYFRKELERYLLLTREMGVDPSSLKGSYTGAMGLPQFMPNSYRHYAVDFNGDGKKDLLGDVADAIGSVGNYFMAHGWLPDEPVAVQAQVDRPAGSPPLNMGFGVWRSVEEWRSLGVTPLGRVAENQPAMLLNFEGEDGPHYWLALRNFYVITRYNHSSLYAMAVYQLSEEIRLARLMAERGEQQDDAGKPQAGVPIRAPAEAGLGPSVSPSESREGEK